MNNNNPYNSIIIIGKALTNGMKPADLDIVATVDNLERQLQWTRVDQFFQVFPPIKNYQEDGTWCYKSTMEMIRTEFGERFSKDDFKKLLMTRCYENRYLSALGLSWVIAVSNLRRKETGISAIEEFLNGEGRFN